MHSLTHTPLTPPSLSPHPQWPSPSVRLTHVPRYSLRAKTHWPTFCKYFTDICQIFRFSPDHFRALRPLGRRRFHCWEGAPGTPLLGRNSGMGAGIHIQRPAQCAHSKPPSSFLQPGPQPALSGAPATNINISVLFHPNRQPNTYLTFIAQQSHHHPPSSVQLLIRMYLCICVFAYLCICVFLGSSVPLLPRIGDPIPTSLVPASCAIPSILQDPNCPPTTSSHFG